jgi:hypothetical protein
MNDMPSKGTSIAPSQNKLEYFLPLKKQYPASPETPVL